MTYQKTIRRKTTSARHRGCRWLWGCPTVGPGKLAGGMGTVGIPATHGCVSVVVCCRELAGISFFPPAFFSSQCWGWNPRSHARQAGVLPLSSIPSPSLCFSCPSFLFSLLAPSPFSPLAIQQPLFLLLLPRLWGTCCEDAEQPESRLCCQGSHGRVCSVLPGNEEGVLREWGAPKGCSRSLTPEWWEPFPNSVTGTSCPGDPLTPAVSGIPRVHPHGWVWPWPLPTFLRGHSYLSCSHCGLRMGQSLPPRRDLFLYLVNITSWYSCLLWDAPLPQGPAHFLVLDFDVCLIAFLFVGICPFSLGAFKSFSLSLMFLGFIITRLGMGLFLRYYC